jgi:hypothetical protein
VSFKHRPIESPKEHMNRQPITTPVAPRRLTDEELADLPLDHWHNVKIDESRYYVSFLKAWEVDEVTYLRAKRAGMLCRYVDGRFILADG